MDALSKFILATSGEPWVYGYSDCAPWVLRWVEEATCKSAPIPEYSDKRGAVRVVKEAGGVLPLFLSFAAAMELPETLSPQRGDVGLLEHPRGLMARIGAVYLGQGKWAAKMTTGQVATFSARPVRIWSLND